MRVNGLVLRNWWMGEWEDGDHIHHKHAQFVSILYLISALHLLFVRILIHFAVCCICV